MNNVIMRIIIFVSLLFKLTFSPKCSSLMLIELFLIVWFSTVNNDIIQFIDKHKYNGKIFFCEFEEKILFCNE